MSVTQLFLISACLSESAGLTRIIMQVCILAINLDIRCDTYTEALAIASTRIAVSNSVGKQTPAALLLTLTGVCSAVLNSSHTSPRHPFRYLL